MTSEEFLISDGKIDNRKKKVVVFFFKLLLTFFYFEFVNCF